MSEMSGILAQDLVVTKAGVHILEALNFHIKPGAIAGLVGPSGSGKTTLMRAIVGVQKIHSGTLTILGQPAGATVLRPRIGYVTQSPAVYYDLTVWQNLCYFATLAGASREQVAQILETVRLGDRRTQVVQTLSGGQKARASLAVALLGDPDVLILDEPTVGLDPVLRQELWQLFNDLAAKGKTLLISSHVMDEAEKCDQLLLLRDGKLLWHDSREELLAATNTTSVEAAFFVKLNEKETA